MQPPTRFSVPALLAFARCHPYVCFWIVLFCAFPIFEAGGLVKVIGWVPVAILSALIVNWLRHYLQGLVPRMTSLDPIAWDAHAGGRIAGVICDDEYARLRYEAYTAPELYGMQFLMMILRSLHVVMYMAVLLIGIGSLYVVANHGFNLDDIHAFLLIVRHLPHEVPHAVVLLLLPMLYLVDLWILTSQIRMHRAGPANVFESAIEEAVRRRIHLKGQSRVHLSHFDGERRIHPSDYHPD